MKTKNSLMAKTILVVDDNKDILEAIDWLLTQEGFSVITAGNGLEALNLLNEFSTDLIILDVLMPGMNGYDVCKKVRNNPAFKKLPIIMLSGIGSEAGNLMGLDSRVNKYIVKPFDNKKLVLIVKSMLGNQDNETLKERSLHLKKILVVDDDKSICEILECILLYEKFKVLFAYSGEEALEKLHDNSPDLVILDVAMPGISGLEVCRRIRKDPIHSRIPIIMLTAKTTKEDRILGYDAGADEYIAKPFDIWELAGRVRILV
jgi:DNA-binding response OmpR family regulator